MGLDRMPHRKSTHRLSPAYKDKIHHRTNWSAPTYGWPTFCSGCGTVLDEDGCSGCGQEQ